jgi:hypothetical protein
LLCNVENLS